MVEADPEDLRSHSFLSQSGLERRDVPLEGRRFQQTLEDLHLAIQQAFGWYDDHLYSFFMSGKAWDSNYEIGCPWSESLLHTHQVQVVQLELKEGQRFLYLFDYGDNHEFDVTLRSINSQAGKGKYPKVVGKQGESPQQYPDYDEI